MFLSKTYISKTLELPSSGGLPNYAEVAHWFQISRGEFFFLSFTSINITIQYIGGTKDDVKK